MPDTIYTHGDISGWLDEESGTPVIKDNRDGKTYDMPSLATDPTELAVFVFSRLMGAGSPADLGATERAGDE